ncbi:MAG: hypothetical protein HOQ02_10320 [Lysobacter sp.]|nr:hypothetical protein [Lysobacter sp.]
MSRTPASYVMPVVRGSTWEDEFTYTDANGAAVDLSGYKARMQVRDLAQEYGTTGTPLLELTTDNNLLVIDTPPGGTVRNRTRIVVPPTAHAVLNPTNARKAKYAYAIELYVPAVGVTPEYVIPLVRGKVVVQGEVTR